MRCPLKTWVKMLMIFRISRCWTQAWRSAILCRDERLVPLSRRLRAAECLRTGPGALRRARLPRLARGRSGAAGSPRRALCGASVAEQGAPARPRFGGVSRPRPRVGRRPCPRRDRHRQHERNHRRAGGPDLEPGVVERQRGRLVDAQSARDPGGSGGSRRSPPDKSALHRRAVAGRQAAGHAPPPAGTLPVPERTPRLGGLD